MNQCQGINAWELVIDLSYKAPSLGVLFWLYLPDIFCPTLHPWSIDCSGELNRDPHHTALGGISASPEFLVHPKFPRTMRKIRTPPDTFRWNSERALNCVI